MTEVKKYLESHLLATKGDFKQYDTLKSCYLGSYQKDIRATYFESGTNQPFNFWFHKGMNQQELNKTKESFEMPLFGIIKTFII